jgi:hypothetical protein
VTDLAARLWPHSADPEPDGEISVGGLRLSALAASCGTPAIILDETDVRHQCRTYRAALPDAEIAYAGTAFLCRAMARWIARSSSWRACTAISARSWDGAPREGRAPERQFRNYALADSPVSHGCSAANPRGGLRRTFPHGGVDRT